MSFSASSADERVLDVQFTDDTISVNLRDGRVSRIQQIIDTFDLVQQVLERDLGALLSGEIPG